ncbi:MAG: aldose 1-epimerase [Robiginitomaculum sp.]|nr:aldose 1-epimerase [Robiginitomaculum sp.]
MAQKTPALIHLKSGGFEVGIAPHIGGSITHYRYRSQTRCIDIFRPFTQSPEAGNQVLRMGCFPLVPYSNRIRDGKINTGSGPVSLPLNHAPEPHSCHGTGWQNLWHVEKHTPHSALLVLPPDKNFPLLYTASQHISLSEEQLQITLTVTNLDQFEFPVGLGLHPYFPTRADAKITANLPHEWTLDSHSMPIDRRQNKQTAGFFKGYKAQALKEMSAYCGWDGRAMLHWPQSGLKLVMRTEPPQAHLLMWAPKGETFFCVEPASHGIDGFDLAQRGAQHVGGFMLAPNKSYTQKFTFGVSFNNPPNTRPVK